MEADPNRGSGSGREVCVDGDTDGGGLRERKRLAAMRRIQEVALDLFDQHGYSQVTIERIAARAEVSPSSVYRYFGTKEQIVLWDEYDPVMFRGFARELRDHPPVVALRRAILGVLDEVMARDEPKVRRRVGYTVREPSIAAASTVQAHQSADEFGRLLCQALGRTEDDLEVRLFSHAMIGAGVGAIFYWCETGFQTPLREVLERGLSALEHGFSFDRRPPPVS
jgi:AcrR family transcriptional regulator